MFNPHDYNADLIDIQADQADELEQALLEADFWAMVDEQEAIASLAALLERCETVGELIDTLDDGGPLDELFNAN